MSLLTIVRLIMVSIKPFAEGANIFDRITGLFGYRMRMLHESRARIAPLDSCNGILIYLLAMLCITLQAGKMLITCNQLTNSWSCISMAVNS